MIYSDFKFDKLLEQVGEVGFVQMITHPIVYVNGLPGVKTHEVVVFENGDIGWVLSLSSNLAEVLLFSSEPVPMGTRVVRTNEPLEVGVGDELLGSTVNALNKSLDERRPLVMSKSQKVDIPALGIEYREKVNEPLETGVAVVDLTIPLGKGQRELVIGDRKTGKTEFLLQAFLTQARKGAVCIYAAIGKKKIDIKKIDSFIQSNNLSSNCILIASGSSDPAGLTYLIPYSAMTIAEYFRDTGRNVLLILDDLTTHAKVYREISLIGKKFPGRSSYPGDMFFSHSRLLERAGNFVTEKGPVSITCLPVAETVESDISGYIQTNIMSMTDGHIFFDQEIFDMGRRPPINYFLSVTRVGRQTQTKLRWSINRELISFLTLLDKTQDFVHFGAEINEGIKSTMKMGAKILNFFNQPMGLAFSLNLQIVLFSLIWSGALNIDDSTDSSITVEKAANTYFKDTVFKNKVDDLVQSSDDFNVLLKKTALCSKDLVDAISFTKTQ